MKEVARRDGVRRVRLRGRRRTPRVLGAAEARPEERDTEVELDDGTLRMESREPVQTVDRSLGPRREGLPDPGLERVGGERTRGRRVRAAGGVEPRRAAQRDRLRVAP